MLLKYFPITKWNIPSEGICYLSISGKTALKHSERQKMHRVEFFLTIFLKCHRHSIEWDVLRLPFGCRYAKRLGLGQTAIYWLPHTLTELESITLTSVYKPNCFFYSNDYGNWEMMSANTCSRMESRMEWRQTVSDLFSRSLPVNLICVWYGLDDKSGSPTWV